MKTPVLPVAILVVGSAIAPSLGARRGQDGNAPVPMCAIDMGSNSFKQIVGSFRHGRYEQESLEKKTLSVGDDVARYGRISDTKFAEIEETLSGFRRSCAERGAAPVVAIGTAAFREAANGGRAVEIAAKFGIPMEIATEQRESELAYLVGSLGQDGYAVIDNGSRSIELVAMEGGSVPYFVFNEGYRLAYENFFARSNDPQAASIAFRDRLRQHASKAPFMKGKKKLVGVEFGEMAEILFESAEVEGRVLTREQLRRTLEQITTAGNEAFQALKKKKDIDRALPRLAVAAALIEEFGYSELELTARELGTGLIIEAGVAQAVK